MMSLLLASKSREAKVWETSRLKRLGFELLGSDAF